MNASHVTGPAWAETSFYVSNSPQEQTTSEPGEGTMPSKDNTQGLWGSMSPDDHLSVTTVLDPFPAPYVGPYVSEDGRFTQLRELDSMFRQIAGKSSGSGAHIPEETLMLLPSISRALMQYVGQLQATNSHWCTGCMELQNTKRQMEASISSLQQQIHKLRVLYDDRGDHIRQQEEFYKSMKAQNDALQVKVDEMERQKDALKIKIDQAVLQAAPGSCEMGSSKKRSVSRISGGD